MSTEAINASPSESAVHLSPTSKEEIVENTRLSAVSAVAGSSVSTQPLIAAPTEPAPKKKPAGMKYSAKLLEAQAVALVESKGRAADDRVQLDGRHLGDAVDILRAWSAEVLATKAKLLEARAARKDAVKRVRLPLATVIFAIREKPSGADFIRTHRKRDTVQTADAVLDHLGEHAFGIDAVDLARLQKAMGPVRNPVKQLAAAKKTHAEAKLVFRAARSHLKAAMTTLKASAAAHAVRLAKAQVASVARPPSASGKGRGKKKPS
jgi:hypothetical protein